MRTSTGKKYFFNKKTKATTWKAPEELEELLARLDGQQSLDFYDPDEEASDEEPLEAEGAQNKSSAAQASSPNAEEAKEASASASGEAAAHPTGETKAQTGGEASEESCTSEESDASGDSSDEEVSTETQKEIAALKDFVKRVEAFKQMLREENLGPFAVYEKVRLAAETR